MNPAYPALFPRLDPFGGASPQRVAIFGTEKTEMADLGRPDIGRRDGEDLRLGRDESRAKQFDCRPRRPGIIGKAQRAHRAIELRKILQAAEPGIVEQIAFAHDPRDPFLEYALRQVLAQAAPPRAHSPTAG